MSGTRRWLAVVLVTALAVPSGLLAPIAASAAGTKKSASTSVTTSTGPVATAAATPTVATTGANGLSGFPTPPVVTTTSTPTVVNTSTGSTAGSSSFSSTNALVIVVGAVAILLGISFFIWRDARRRAPVREVSAGLSGDGRTKPGSKRPPKPRKLSPAERKRRKRGKTRR